jgi:hypothetical protein
VRTLVRWAAERAAGVIVWAAFDEDEDAAAAGGAEAEAEADEDEVKARFEVLIVIVLRAFVFRRQRDGRWGSRKEGGWLQEDHRLQRSSDSSRD